MDAIASQLEGKDIQWCYPFTLELWNDVPEKNGVDLGDYIADGHTYEDIQDRVYAERIGDSDTRQLNHDTTLEELIKFHEKQLDSAEILKELKKLQARTRAYDFRELQQLYKALSEDIDKKVNEQEAFVRLTELV